MAPSVSEIERAICILRGSIRFRSHECLVLVLGLIFLRYIEIRFGHTGQQDAGGFSIDSTNTGNAIHVSQQSCFSSLLANPPEHVGEAINLAMRSLEADNPKLASVLPQQYDQLETHILIDLLHVLSAIPFDAGGNGLEDIFDGFLASLADLSGQAGGEFYTPPEIAQLLAKLVKPQVGMTIYDPCAGSGGILLEAREHAANIERYSRVVEFEEVQEKAFNLNIQRYVDSSPLAGLVTQYSQYGKVTLREISLQINSVTGTARFQHHANAVYIPRTGPRRPTTSPDDLGANQSNFLQVMLTDHAMAEYVAQFLGSSAGQHALSLVAQGSVVKRVSKSELCECMIAVPDIATQREIVATHRQLSTLKDAIGKLDQELSLNPTGKAELRKQVESLLAVIGQLSDADEVRYIVREGESKSVEFKEVFTIEPKGDKKDQHMQTATFKTIVAFLNSEGGRLLVGVNDDQKIVGINDELAKFHKNNHDDFLKHFKNLLKSRVGEEFYPFIHYRIIAVDAFKVFVVTCDPSKSPCFLDAKDFYVRINPASDKLEGPTMVQYISNHFRRQSP
jgi:hypothetical protein